MISIGYDTETFLIAAPDDIIPRIVCASFDATSDTEQGPTDVVSTGDPDLWDFHCFIYQKAYAHQARIIIHNASFDISVGLRYCQDVANGTRPGDASKAKELYLLIWQVLEKNMGLEWDNAARASDPMASIAEIRPNPLILHDTLIREKLYFLSKYGGITVAPWGKELRYTLADLAKRHLDIDLFDGKVSTDANGRIYDADKNDITGTPKAGAAWRLRYSELDGIPVNQWPAEAYQYALSDATYARLIWDKQEAKRTVSGHGSMNSEALQIYADTALRITTATGWHIDQQQVARVNTGIQERLGVLSPRLFESGILRSNGSINKGVVQERVERWWDFLGRPPLLTEGGDIATGKEVLEILADLDISLTDYSEYSKISKLRDAFMPNLTGTRVFCNYDILKETGRTSSYGASEKKGRKPLYQAVNGQQMPRRPGIRECFLPPPANADAPNGYVIASVDYGALELCSTAQCTYNLFGYSKHRDKINEGYDLHAYLGSGLAMYTDPTCIDGEVHDRDAAYRALVKHRKDRIPDEDKSPEAEYRRTVKKLAAKYRDMAKPVGLGYPGGLGSKTMVVFAKTVYHVDFTAEQADTFRDLWLATYPEMKDYFDWVNKQVDYENRESDGSSKYCYETPGFRRFRAGATYCAVANGASMQSLSADGAKRSVAWLQRACCGGIEEGNPYRILDKCLHLGFIHDENLIAIPYDALMTERALAIEKIMIEAMKVHMSHVRITAEPALMTRWTKGAEPEWVPDSHLGRGTVSLSRQRAWELACEQYGHADATGMFQELVAKDPSKRLDAWDLHNKIKEF